MWIDSHDRYDLVAEFEPVTGRLAPMDRASSSAANDHTGGHFAYLSSATAILYRFEGSLWLRINGQARSIEREDVAVQHSREARSTVLRLIENDAVVAEVEYETPRETSGFDPTAFTRSEDWDFGEFVVNVSRDSQRRDRMYRGWA